MCWLQSATMLAKKNNNKKKHDLLNNGRKTRLRLTVKFGATLIAGVNKQRSEVNAGERKSLLFFTFDPVSRGCSGVSLTHKHTHTRTHTLPSAEKAPQHKSPVCAHRLRGKNAATGETRSIHSVRRLTGDFYSTAKCSRTGPSCPPYGSLPRHVCKTFSHTLPVLLLSMSAA